MPSAATASLHPDSTQATARRWARHRLALCAGLLTSLVSLPAAAGSCGGHCLAGRSLAAQFCSECHLIGREPQASGFLGLPFLAIANSPSTTGLSLSVFLRSHHQRMPSFRLERDEMDAIIDYILSLRGSEAQRL
ncbi:c-type cytochrome [Methylobacterium sp. P31]